MPIKHNSDINTTKTVGNIPRGLQEAPADTTEFPVDTTKNSENEKSSVSDIINEDPEIAFRKSVDSVSHTTPDAVTFNMFNDQLFVLCKPLSSKSYEHEHIDMAISEIVENKLSNADIHKIFAFSDLLCFGKFKDYNDFNVKALNSQVCDPDNFGMMIGRIWTKYKIISCWETDEKVQQQLPSLLRMLQQLNIPQSKILSYKLDLADVRPAPTIKQLLVKTTQHKSSSTSISDLQQARIVHTTTNPFDRKQLKQQLGIINTAAATVPDSILKFVRDNPDKFDTIRWSDYNLSTETAKILIQQRKAKLNETPDRPFGNAKRFGFSYDDPSAISWIVRNRNLVLFAKIKDQYHSRIHYFIQTIIDKKFNSSLKIKKFAQSFKITIIGDYSSYTDFELDETKYPQRMGMGMIVGRYWPKQNLISTWNTDAETLTPFNLGQIVFFLKHFGVPPQRIQETKLDLQRHINDNTAWDQITTLKDAVSKQRKHNVSTKKQARLDKELQHQQQQAHVETDPIKRKLLQKRFNLGNITNTKKIPKMVQQFIQNNPQSASKVNLSKFKAVNESPDELKRNKIHVIWKTHGTAFYILDDSAFLILKNGQHRYMFPAIQDIISHTSWTVQNIRKRLKNSNIQFLGDESKLNSTFFKSKLSKSADYREFGLLSGRFWERKNVISIWQDDSVFLQNIPAIKKMLIACNAANSSDVGNYKVDVLKQDDMPTISELESNNITTSKLHKPENDRSVVHTMTDPIRRKLAKQRLNMLPSQSSIDSFKQLPTMIKNQLLHDPTLLDRVNWSKFGLTADTVQKIVTIHKNRQAIFEDADGITVHSRKYAVTSPNSITFGYINGVMFYTTKQNGNHQQLYHELKSVLSPNYSKLQAALNEKNVKKVNHFLNQIVNYLHSKQISVMGDVSNLVFILRDIFENNIESLSSNVVQQQLSTKSISVLRKNAYKIRKHVFEISGRAWTDVNIASFWNSVSSARKCLAVFELIADTNKYRYEFIDNTSTFFTKQQINNNELTTAAVGDLGKIHSTTTPDERKRLKRNAGTINPIDYSKHNNLAPWQRKQQQGIDESCDA